MGQVVKGCLYKVLFDWDYGKFYIVVVIICNFVEDVGVEGEGGEFVLYVSYGDWYRYLEWIVVFMELMEEYNVSCFDFQKFFYDYVYCGFFVYGDISL